MGCWNELDLALQYKILLNVSPIDLLICQSVSKSLREVAIDLYYNTLEINDSTTAVTFLQGQLQALQPRGGLFVNSINVTESFAPSTLQQTLPSETMKLFAKTCPNVQYLMGDGRHYYFWNALKTLQVPNAEYWSQLKRIPFNFTFSKEYLDAASVFSKSLTNLTIKDLPREFINDKGGSNSISRELLAYIKATFPRVESLEIYNRKIKHLFELNDLTFFIPNLRHLVLGRGRPSFLFNIPRNSQIQIRTGNIEPLRKLEILKLLLPKVCFDTVHFLFRKFPNVKDVELIFDKPVMLTRNDWSTTASMLRYLVSRERYYMALPVDHPAILLENYYHYFPPTVGQNLIINYGPSGKLNSRRLGEDYFPDVIIQKQQKYGPSQVELNYFYFENDDYFLELTKDIFQVVGNRLETLDINMSGGYIYTLGNELMNGYFLDTLIFKYCNNLKSLRLQHFHLVRCTPMLTLNPSIQELYIVNSVIHDQQIIIDISARLDNLKEVVMDECVMDSGTNAINYIFNNSHLDKLTITDNLESHKKWIRWLLIFTESGGQKTYRRVKPASTFMVECSYDEFQRNCAPDHIKVSIYCKSVKMIHINSAQFQIKTDFKLM